MKKKLFSVMLGLLALIVVFTSSAFADGSKKSGLFTYEIKGNGTAIITAFDWKSNGNEDVYIPRMLDGYTVTEIGELAFSNTSATYKSLVGDDVVIVIPDTITIIGNKAFFCTAITSINIPSSVQMIGGGAFAGCSNIRQFTVDSENTVFATIEDVLYNKTKKEVVAYPLGKELSVDERIVIPNGIVSVGEYAFYSLKLDYYRNGVNSWSRQRIVLPDSLIQIGNYAFAESDLNFSHHIDGVKDEPFIFPQSLLSIGDYAFFNCKISQIMLPETLEKIGDYAFSKAIFWTYYEGNGYNGFVTGFELPKSLLSIGTGAFADIETKYNYFDLAGSGVKIIEPFTFREVYVGSLMLPASLEEIQASAFEGALGLTTIPNTVKVIGNKAFYAGGGNIEFENGSVIETIGEDAFHGYHFNGQGTLTLPNGLLEIGKSAFDDTTDLSLLVIPSSVTKIGHPLCDRADVTLQVESGSYAAIFASENGYTTKKAGGDDTSWLNS